MNELTYFMFISWLLHLSTFLSKCTIHSETISHDKSVCNGQKLRTSRLQHESGIPKPKQNGVKSLERNVWDNKYKS